MNNLESLKNELIAQKNMLQQKNYTVNVSGLNPSPSEITTALSNVLENNPDVSTYANYYKGLLDADTFNAPINNIVIPEGTENIRTYFCAGLKENLTGSLTLPSSVKTIGVRAFADTNIDSVTFNSELTTINDYAFYNAQLTSLNIPDSVTKIGTYCFSGNTDIAQLTLSNNLTQISSNNFKTLNSLTTLTIPASVTTISAGNFNNVTSLLDLTILGNSTVFSSSQIFTSFNSNLRIWVNFDRLEYYVKHTNCARVSKNFVSQTTVSGSSWPSLSISTAWYANYNDCINKTNALSAPNGEGTYYCRSI